MLTSNSTFPRYPVLQFHAVSMHLVLGPDKPTNPSSAAASPFDRVPGCPLCSADGQLVGSLHPDNVELLPAPESCVECIVVARCNTPTVGSALLPPDSPVPEKAWELLWVLHVTWQDGIAERRGVGQVLASALETAAEPSPQVKTVLLG